MSAEGLRARYAPGGSLNALLGTEYDLTPVNPGPLDRDLSCNQIPALNSKQMINTKEIKTNNFGLPFLSKNLIWSDLQTFATAQWAHSKSEDDLNLVFSRVTNLFSFAIAYYIFRERTQKECSEA